MMLDQVSGFCTVGYKIVQFPCPDVPVPAQFPLSVTNRSVTGPLPEQPLVSGSLFTANDGSQIESLRWQNLCSFAFRRIFCAGQCLTGWQHIDDVADLFRDAVGRHDTRKPHDERGTDTTFMDPLFVTPKRRILSKGPTGTAVCVELPWPRDPRSIVSSGCLRTATVVA